MKIFRRAVQPMLCILLALLLLAACGSAPLPEGMEEEKVQEIALTVMQEVNAKNYEAVTQLFREDLATVSPETWEEQLNPVWDALGNFIEYTKTEVSGYKLEDGTLAALALISCKYEKGQTIWAIILDTNYKLTGVRIAG